MFACCLNIKSDLDGTFQEPNPEDPLNKEAADELQSNRRLFEQHVQRAMRGGYVGSSYFERCLK